MKYLRRCSDRAVHRRMAYVPAANAAATAPGGVYNAACVAGAYDYVVVRRRARWSFAARRCVVGPRSRCV